MGAQIQAKTSAVSDTDINKARPFNCKKLMLKERGKQLILILIVLIQNLQNLLQQKRNGLTIIGGPPEELWHGTKEWKKSSFRGMLWIREMYLFQKVYLITIQRKEIGERKVC